MSFVPLHLHTMYSIKDGMGKIKDYVKRAKELGMPALAITDHGVMYGVVDFYKECLDKGIKPIIGCEVYVAPKSRLEKDPKHRYQHLVLLAENNEGYQNLAKICSEGFGPGFYFKPRVDDEVIREHKKGLIALSACLAGRIPEAIQNDDYESAKSAALAYQELFGEGNFFLELQDHGIPAQKKVNAGIMRLHNETGIPLVVTNDTHYVYREDADAHDVLLCMQQQKLYTDDNRMKDKEGEYYLKSEEDMRALFPYAPEAIENTGKIAERCNVLFKFHETKMPVFPVPDGMTAFEYLQKLCYEGMQKRYGDQPNDVKEDIRKQLDYQLGVIRDMGYVEYFLIVQDYCSWARNNGISVGPGRGSAAGSYVTYCIGITDIDPRAFDLQFERFLNPERVSMPDIDVDFDDRGRGRVIEHVKELYGEQNVSQIITFQTMAAREVIKDTGKVLGYPYAFCDNLSKMVPSEVKMTLKKSLKANPEFKKAYDGDPQVKRLIDMAMRLEGLPKSTGTHAAGVIISDKPLSEYMPLSKTVDGTGVVSQFTMTTVEELGHLKMDFLGLRTLTVISDAIENIRKNKGISVSIDDIDYNDREVYAHIGTGATNGMFQLESKGMQDFMKQLKPESIEDLTAGISLYRPGPMDYIPQYIQGKRNASKVTYDCPQLEPILKNTYGCIVYQEQVTRIVRDLAGYSMGAADNIRRAMSKKKEYVIAENREIFVHGGQVKRNDGGYDTIPGCVANGISADVANGIYDHMVDFAKYAFNKSHAACYAVISFQTAWLMHYYPVEYWAAIMTSVIGNADKLTGYIQAAKSAGIKILSPNINESEERFMAVGDNILFALAGIKAVSETTAEAIRVERERNGQYASYPDAIKRLQDVGADRSCIENLIYAGAFDVFGGKRSQYIMTFEGIMQDMKRDMKKNITGQISMFDIIPEMTLETRVQLPNINEYKKSLLLENEKKATGCYISGHPLDEYRSYIERRATKTAADFREDEETGKYGASDGERCKICGIIAEKKVIYTKKSEAMAFLEVEDLYGRMSVIVFPSLYAEIGSALSEDVKVMVEGTVSISDEKGAAILAKRIARFEDLPATLAVQTENEDTYNNMKEHLLKTLEAHRGTNPVAIYTRSPRARMLLPTKYHVKINDDLLNELESLAGQENVAIC